MFTFSTHRLPIALGIAAGAALTIAPSASAGVSLTSSASSTFLGASVTLKISSDVAAPIVVRQVRVSKLQGPGRCSVGLPYFDSYLGGRSLKTIDYTAPGSVVAVTLPATRLEYFGGNLLAGLPSGIPEDSRCDDFPTQFTKIGAFQANGSPEGDVSHKPLVRLF